MSHPRDEFDAQIDDFRWAMAMLVEATGDRAASLVKRLSGRVDDAQGEQAKIAALWDGACELGTWLRHNDPFIAELEASTAPETWWDLWEEDPASARAHRVLDCAFANVYADEIDELS